MSIRDACLEVEGAVGGLRRVADDSSGWSDQQRVRFDRQRLKLLLDAGDQLIRALRRADETIVAVENALQNDR